MRVFVAGATGAIGMPLVAELLAGGHEVAGLTRSPQRAQLLTTQGAHAVVCDLYDSRLADRVADFWPDVIIHQVTDLPSRQALIPMKLVSLNKARTRGTDVLIAAARAAGASTFIAQSVAFSLPGIARRALDHLERETLAYPGIVLRYGAFYGPGTWNPSAPSTGPVVEVTAAAQQTARALQAAPGVYEVTDEGTRAVEA